MARKNTQRSKVMFKNNTRIWSILYKKWQIYELPNSYIQKQLKEKLIVSFNIVT